MEEFQQRVVDEKADLDDKIEKLGAFLESAEAKTSNISILELVRLLRQLEQMKAYSETLEERIEHFS